jgi:hypothetical protein
MCSVYLSGIPDARTLSGIPDKYGWKGPSVRSTWCLIVSGWPTTVKLTPFSPYAFQDRDDRSQVPVANHRHVQWVLVEWLPPLSDRGTCNCLRRMHSHRFASVVYKWGDNRLGNRKYRSFIKRAGRHANVIQELESPRRPAILTRNRLCVKLGLKLIIL